jgi:hypothetical protein
MLLALLLNQLLRHDITCSEQDLSFGQLASSCLLIWTPIDEASDPRPVELDSWSSSIPPFAHAPPATPIYPRPQLCTVAAVSQRSPSRTAELRLHPPRPLG